MIQLLVSFLIGIVLIILLTAKFKVHPLFALLIASFVVGLGAGMPGIEVVNTVKEGFGHIMRSLGMIIILGTTLGIVLEKSGATKVMADRIQRTIGRKRPALAMSVTGFIVGFPIFCDSGFIVLSGLNKTLAKQTGVPVIIMAVSMATGLYSVHCLLPPHPGAAAAAGIMGVDYGKLILYGTLVAIPAAVVGYLYAGYAGRKIKEDITDNEEETSDIGLRSYPSATISFLPVIVPIALITLKSFTTVQGPFTQAIALIGDPVIALAIGVICSLFCIRQWNGKEVNRWLGEAVEKAGGILVIIGAGGAFGAILTATQIGKQFSESLPLAGMGLLFPFLITFLLKTAQGSSTVAIITAASIVQPLLPVLGLVSPESKMLCVLAMGAGSMMISHANDAYFWVIARFEKIPMQPMLRVYSIATLLMGLVSIAAIFVLRLFV